MKKLIMLSIFALSSGIAMGMSNESQKMITQHPSRKLTVAQTNKLLSGPGAGCPSWGCDGGGDKPVSGGYPTSIGEKAGAIDGGGDKLVSGGYPTSMGGKAGAIDAITPS
jgi:hypothetical protein